jgi:lipopolysaccharide transport system ATP-binding protein
MYHWALRDLSFELQPGESLGIIGPNGAGKTTLLKLLSKVTYPTKGEIFLNGRYSSLIELGAGFHPELTGRENIFLNGTILGMRRSEIRSRFDAIVEFSGIDEYLDAPVKRYSSGMYARLGFSVAVHVDPEILLVDEVLAVGDVAFRAKCYKRMLKLLENGTTLIFVSHNFSAVQRVCSRCMVLYRGDLVFDGRTADAIAEYSNILRRAAGDSNLQDIQETGGLSKGVMTHGAEIESVQILQSDGRSASTFSKGDTALVRMNVSFLEPATSPIFACTVRRDDGELVYDFTTHWANLSTPDFIKNSQATIEFRLVLNLVGGTYHLGVDLAYNDLSRYYDRIIRAVDFVVTSNDAAQGIADLECEFTVR